MKVALLTAAVGALAGCRGNFESLSDAQTDAAPDAPLPELVCAAQVSPVPKILGVPDLAVTSQDLRYVVAWTDAGDGSVSVAQADRSRTLMGQPQRLIASGVRTLAGLEATPERVWMVTTGAATQTLWTVAPNLTSATAVMTEESVAGVESIAVATTLNLKPIWVRGGFADNTIRLSYLSSEGTVGVANTYLSPGKVDAMSFADYTNHAHLGWRTDNGRCWSSDVAFDTAPTITGRTIITDDCKAMRTVSGPPPHDPLVMTWANSTGNIRIRYDGSTIPPGGTDFNVGLGNGRAPRISFDGEAYWVAWIDSTGLRFSRIDKTGVVKTSGVPGYFPVGDEAFELVARGGFVDLVVLEKNQLGFLSLCNDGA